MMQTEIYEFAADDVCTSDQYVLVQNNSNFLINNAGNREIQYVTQIEDQSTELATLQPCPVFDFSQQQYYVDNASDLIVSESLSLHNGGHGNIYDESFNQAMEVISEKPSTPDITDIIVEATTPIASVEGTQDTGRTEIMLNEQQCQLLEDRGWILLETNEKVYVLNALGLHDITNNNEVIQKCRNYAFDNEINNELVALKSNVTSNIIPQPSYVAMEDLSTTYVEATVADDISNQINSSKIIIIQQESLLKNQSYTVKNQKKANVKIAPKPIIAKKKKQPDNVIQVKTQWSSEEVPEKIFLGYLENGNKLFAQSKKHVNPENNMEDVHKTRHTNGPVTLILPNIIKGGTEEGDNTKSCVRLKSGKKEFKEEIEEAMRHASSMPSNSCSAEDLSSAETTISQLLEMPDIRDMMIARNILLTKVQKRHVSKDNVVTTEFHWKSIVAGRVAQFDVVKGTWHFIYVPHLVAKLFSQKPDEDEYVMSVSGEPVRRTRDAAREDSCLLHLHVSETLHQPHSFLTLTNRQLPWKPKNMTTTAYKPVLHACSACATKFKTEKELLDHQKVVCTSELADEESLVIVDTYAKDKMIPLTVTCGRGRKFFVCPHCGSIFNRHVLYRRHLATHFGQNYESQASSTLDSQSDSLNDNPTKQKSYKCKMCIARYLHPVTLTKHIMTKHVNYKS